MRTGILIFLLASAIYAEPAGNYGGRGYYSQQNQRQFGERTQHFELNENGNYNFGYNTGDGSFQDEKRSGNVVQGSYGRKNEDGTFVNVQYQATATGDGAGSGRYSGFQSAEKGYSGVPALPRAPFQAPAPVQQFPSPKGYSAPLPAPIIAPPPPAPKAYIAPRPAPVVAPSPSKGYSPQPQQYRAPPVAPSPVKGYSAPQPQPYRASVIPQLPSFSKGYSAPQVAPAPYRAPAPVPAPAPVAAKGYSALPAPAPAPIRSYSKAGSSAPLGSGDGSFSYSFTAQHAPGVNVNQGANGYSLQLAPNVAQQYSSSSSGYGASRGGYRGGEEVVPNINVNPDGSYNFNFQTNEQYRTETRGSDGSVRGQFGHTDPEGNRRNYAFTAGHGTGFQITGDDLPKQPEVPQSSSYQSGYQQSQRYGSVGGFQRQSYTEQFDQDDSPKPFSFNYNAGDHGRSESQDSQGTVRGSYTVNTVDGGQKLVSYQADDNGFQITDEKTVGGAGGASAPSTGKSGYAYTG